MRAPISEVLAEEVELADLTAVNRARRSRIWRPRDQAGLQGKRVRFFGYLKSSRYYVVQPEQLLGTVAAEVAVARDGEEGFIVWLPNSTDVTTVGLPDGTRVEVEATLRTPLFGRLCGECAIITSTDVSG